LGCHRPSSKGSKSGTVSSEQEISSKYTLPSYITKIKEDQWIKENATVQGYQIVFNERINPDTLLTKYKKNIGFSENDSFVLVKAEPLVKDITRRVYRHNYKGIEVVPNRTEFIVDAEGKSGSIQAYFIMSAPDLYKKPMDSDIVFKKIAQHLGCVYTMKGKEKDETNYLLSTINLNFNSPLEKRGTEGEEWWCRAGAMEFIYTIKIGCEGMWKWYEVDADAITGEIIEIDMKAGIKN